MDFQVRRGNYGDRHSGGLGAGSSHGAGYGGVSVVGAQFSGQGGPHIVFDNIALTAVSGPNNAFMNSYQVLALNLKLAIISQGLNYQTVKLTKILNM